MISYDDVVSGGGPENKSGISEDRCPGGRGVVVEVGQVWVRCDGDTGRVPRPRVVERVDESFAWLRSTGYRPDATRWPLTRVRVRNGRLPGHKLAAAGKDGDER